MIEVPRTLIQESRLHITRLRNTCLIVPKTMRSYFKWYGVINNRRPIISNTLFER